MTAINKAIDSITGSRWRRFMALAILGLVIGQGIIVGGWLRAILPLSTGYFGKM